MYKIKTFHFTLVVQILILCSVNHLWAQLNWPMVIKNTRFPDYPFPLSRSLLIRTSPDSTSSIRTSFLYLSGYDGKLVASAVVPGVGIGGTVVSPPLGYPSGQTTSYWYRVYIPGVGLTAPTEGYCAAGTTFTNPECGAPYIEVVFSSVFIRTGPSASSLNVTIGGLPAKIFLGQKYAVADQLDVGGIRWYQIHLPKGTNTHPEDCSQNTGWVAGSSGSTTLVTLGTTGTNALPAPSALNTSSVTHDVAALNWSMNFYPAKTYFSINTCSGSSVGFSYDPTTSCFSYTPTNCTISSLPNCTNCVYAQASYVSEMAVCVSSNSAPHSVTLQTPSAVTVTGVTPFCESTTLSASGGSGGTIYYQGLASGGTSTTTAMTSQTVYSTGTYFFRSKSSAGCWGPEGSIFVSTNRPSPPVVSGGGTHCNTATITASGGSDGTIYYQGSVMGGTSISDPSTSKIITSSGTYYFRKRSSTGCWGDPAGISVTINTAPGSITGATNVCAGSAISLSNATPSGTWSSSNTSVAVVELTSGVVNGISNGVATITYRTDCGFATYNITVNPLPLSISGIGSVCEGMATTLTNATGGGTWSSGDTSRATVVTGTGEVTGVSVGTVLISYILPTGCYITKELTINPFPSTIAGATEVCAESTITLSNTVGGGTWSSSNPSVATVGLLTGVVTGVATGTSVITYTVGASCYETKTITVNPIPLPITGSNSVCVGITTTLNNATLGGTWSSSNSFVASIGSATGIVNGVLAGTVVLSYILPTGCYDTNVITVNPRPSIIGGPSEVCAGSTIMLSNAIGGGTWSSNNSSVATVGLTSGLVTGVTVGTTMITYSVSGGCFETKIITVNPVPSSIIGNNSICLGFATTLSNITGGGTWSSSNMSIATIESNTGVVNGISVGTVIVSYVLTTGCFVTMEITVKPLPSVISGPTVLCVGANINLSNTVGGGTWSSSNPSLATVGLSTGVVNGLTAGTAIITYTIAASCYETKIITVNPLPSSITGSHLVCEGSSTTLSSTTSGGTWSSSNNSIATVGAGSGIVTGVSNGTATITYRLNTGCQTTYSMTVSRFPEAGTITGPSTVCVGATINLTTSVIGGSWYLSNGNITLTPSGIVTGISSGVTSISYVVANICGATFTSTVVTINPLPDAGVILGDSSVCIGSTLHLTESVVGGIWGMNNSLATVSGGVVTGLVPGKDTCTYTVSNICGTDIARKTIFIDTMPVVAALIGPADVCVGSDILVTDSTTSGIWRIVIGNAINLGNVIKASTTGSDTIYYTITNACGSDSTSHAVTIHPSLDAGTINGIQEICIGDSDTLWGYTEGGIWSNVNGNIFVSNGIITGIKAGVDTVIYTVSNLGCSDVAILAVTVNQLPFAGTIIGPDKICEGDTVSFSSTVLGGNWGSINSSISMLNDSIAHGMFGGIDTLFYSVENMCGIDTTIKVVTIKGLPDAGLINGPTTLCVGGTILLKDTVTGGVWSSSNSLVSVAEGSVTGIDVGFSMVRYVVVNECGVDTAKHLVQIYGQPSPPIIERTFNDIYVTPIYGSYQWSVNGTEIPDAVMHIHKVLIPGMYGIKISDMYGCYNYSTLKIDTIFCDSSSLQVYPNPSKSIINFDWCKPLNARLHCADGRFVKFEKGVNKIDVSDLSNGIYLLSLFNEELKLIKVVKLTKLD